MKYLVAKDIKRRVLFKKFEKKRQVLKMVSCNEFLDKKIRNRAVILLSYTPGLFVQIRNRCIYSGRARAFIRDYKVSRSFFKKFANFGYLKGVKKASW